MINLCRNHQPQTKICHAEEHRDEESFQNKSYKTILLSIILILTMTIPVFGMGIQVQDEANLLDANAEARLTLELEEAEAKTGWDIIVLSIADAGGKTARVYAEDLYDANLIIEDGVTCIIDMDNREIALQTTGEAIYYLTDARISDVLDASFAAASSGDYESSFSTMITEVVACYDMGAQGNYAYNEDTGKITTYKSIEPIEAMIAVVLALVVFVGIGVGIIGKYRLKFGGYKYSPNNKSSVHLTKEEDRFVHQTVTHRRIPRNNGHGPGGGGGGRSTVRGGSSGRSHGGGSRGF
ncbi:TPM domain-containing protein [Chakrabartyella piscis]|uniref:TPM domain-containing protein n=1 Tax=Chakrabartyella piscis TaxID=2918914 RepID=UPI002958855C|nr:TPM domain-containing protein [Chakrabartyella piscis]